MRTRWNKPTSTDLNLRYKLPPEFTDAKEKKFPKVDYWMILHSTDYQNHFEIWNIGMTHCTGKLCAHSYGKYSGLMLKQEVGLWIMGSLSNNFTVNLFLSLTNNHNRLTDFFITLQFLRSQELTWWVLLLLPIWKMENNEKLQKTYNPVKLYPNKYSSVCAFVCVVTAEA